MKINSKNGLSKMQVTDVIYPCSRVAGSIGLCPQMKNPTFYVGMFILIESHGAKFKAQRKILCACVNFF